MQRGRDDDRRQRCSRRARDGSRCKREMDRGGLFDKGLDGLQLVSSRFLVVFGGEERSIERVSSTTGDQDKSDEPVWKSIDDLMKSSIA